MSLLKNITLSVCILSLVYSILMLLTPDRFHRQTSIVLSLITAVVIGSFFINLDELPDDWLSGKTPGGYNSFTNRQELLVKELEEELSLQIAKIFSENGVQVEKIYLRTDIDEDNCIFISELVITICGGRERYDSIVENIVRTKIGEINYRIVYQEDADGA